MYCDMWLGEEKGGVQGWVILLACMNGVLNDSLFTRTACECKLCRSERALHYVLTINDMDIFIVAND